MKKSYFRLMAFLFLFILFFLANSFIFHVLTQQFLDVLLLVLIVFSYFLFGVEKDRHRYRKDIVLEIFITLISFFLLYYVLGIFTSFARGENYFTVSRFFQFVFPLIIYILLKEFLRYQLVMKASESKILMGFVCFFFIVMDNTIPFSAHVFQFNREIFLLVALTFLPSITENILCTYLGFHFGYFPSICYLFIVKLYPYLLPIVPNPNEYFYSLIFLLLPTIVLFRVKKWLSNDRTEEVIVERFKKIKLEMITYLGAGILMAILVYAVSGYFRYYTVAVASGSMEKLLSKGDVVIVDQKEKQFQQGDVIAYRYNGVVIVHRIYRIVDVDDGYFIYTKGDANANPDRWKITKDEVVGLVKFKIPLLGYPTVLLNEMW